jgi:hypothetical protein
MNDVYKKSKVKRQNQKVVLGCEKLNKRESVESVPTGRQEFQGNKLTYCFSLLTFDFLKIITSHNANHVLSTVYQAILADRKR